MSNGEVRFKNTDGTETCLYPNGEKRVFDKDGKEVGILRKSRITKGISRTLSTAKYESIVIHTEIQEDVEWLTLDERDKKIRNWDTLLLQDFKKTHDEVLDELRLSHKPAYFKNNLDEKDYRADANAQHELDSLDVLR